MARYKLVVMSKPAEGREDEYNGWYQTVHLHQLLEIEGVKSAQRFRLTEALTPGDPSPYMAIYDVETNDPQKVLDEIRNRAESEVLTMTGALHPDVDAVLYEEFGAPVKS